MMRSQMHVCCVLTLLCALAVLPLAAPVLADDDVAAATRQEQTAAAGAVASADPVTDGLVSIPTEAERAELWAAVATELNSSFEGLSEVELPDGSVVIDLQGRFRHVVVAHVAPDGTRQVECIDHLPETAGGSPVSPAPEQTDAAAAE
jgi:hypothetical protein